MFQPIDISNYEKLDNKCNEHIKELYEIIQQEEKHQLATYVETYIGNCIKKAKIEKMIYASLTMPNPDRRMFQLLMESYERQNDILYKMANDMYSRGECGNPKVMNKSTMEGIKDIKRLCKHTGIYDL